MDDSTMILDETNRKNLIFLILQFLHEEGFDESLHLLEQDSGVFFDFSYFSNAILNGNWEDAEDYLSAFTTPKANTFSRNMFIRLYKAKFSDRSGGSKSVNIFSEDFRRITVLKDDCFEDLVQVFAADDIRAPEQISCVDKSLVRSSLCVDLRKLAESNPSLHGKLAFPNLNKSALLSLISLICPISIGRKEDLICLILQFLFEAKYKSTFHRLEQETKVSFNLNYLAEVMVLGQLGKAEEYLASFTNKHDNKYSKAMFLELQKLKCAESTSWEVTTPSGSLDNTLPKKKLHDSVVMLAKKNPALKDKLKLPDMEQARLLKLMKMTMDWWKPQSCNNSNSLENIPVVPYLCGAPSSFTNKFNRTGPRTKVKNCKPKEINDPSECNALVLPNNWSGERIECLTYSPSGDYILALADDGTHKLWTWSSNQKEFCKHTPRILKEDVYPKPRLHQPMSGKTMKNEEATSVQDSTSCFAIKGSYLFSTSGGKIAVFDLKSFEKVAAFGSHVKPMATYFIFIPGDLLAVGLDDGSILIHCLSSRKIKEKRDGHDQRITCLAFSRCFNVLVSSGADGKLCVWSTKSWLKLKCIDSIQKFCTRGNDKSSSVVTHVQFDPYHIELLVVQEKWIGVHEAPTLDCLMQWFPDESDAAITSATYSSDGEIIYVGFRSESIKVLVSKTLLTICRINLNAFAQPIPSNISDEVFPVVVTSHPSHRSQFSVGFSNGKVIVFQPLGRGGWGEAVPFEDDENCSDGSDHCY